MTERAEGAGPEGRLVQSKENQKVAKNFFEEVCKWNFLAEGKDIKESKKSRRKRGIDLLFTCFEPFLNKDLLILTECKYRKDDDNINSKTLSEMVYTLKDKIACARNSPSWDETSYADIVHRSLKDYGIIFLELKEYSNEEWEKTLKSIPISDKDRNDPEVIGIVSNYRISKIYEFVSKKEGLKFFYPAYRRNNSRRYENYISYMLFFSDIIAGKYLKDGEEIGFLISFEKPSEDAVKYISNVLKIWGLYDEVSEVYFSEADRRDIEIVYNAYKNKEDKFEIKALGGDISLNSYELE